MSKNSATTEPENESEKTIIETPIEEILPELCRALRVILQAVPLALERLEQGVSVERQSGFWHSIYEWEEHYYKTVGRGRG